MTIPLVPPLLAGSSDLPGSFGRAVRRSRHSSLERRRITLPYLVLLRAGFCLPSVLRQTRCALTAPFHPYPPSLAHALRHRRVTAWRYIFCATFLQVALTGRYPAHCPSEFGLSSRLRPSGLRRSRPLRACHAVALEERVDGRSSCQLRRLSVTQKGLRAQDSGLRDSGQFEKAPSRSLPRFDLWQPSA